MSTSFDPAVAERTKFRKQLIESGANAEEVVSVIWEIEGNHSARDARELFSSLKTKYPDEQEAIVPQGSRFELASAEPKIIETLDEAGNPIRTLVFSVRELP